MTSASPPVEIPTRIEPCFIEAPRGELLDLLTELPAMASQLSARLHPRTAASLANLVGVMNCFYSNLIEGHNTCPRDIERALADELDADETRRNLQIEARAHIRQQGITLSMRPAVRPNPTLAPDGVEIRRSARRVRVSRSRES